MFGIKIFVVNPGHSFFLPYNLKCYLQVLAQKIVILIILQATPRRKNPMVNFDAHGNVPSPSSNELHHTYWNDTLRRKREAKNEPQC